MPPEAPFYFESPRFTDDPGYDQSPDSFAAFPGDGSPRTPARILAHMGDLFGWALTQAAGKEAWSD